MNSTTAHQQQYARQPTTGFALITQLLLLIVAINWLIIVDYFKAVYSKASSTDLVKKNLFDSVNWFDNKST